MYLYSKPIFGNLSAVHRLRLSNLDFYSLCYFRIVGGLLGAHLLQHRSGATLEPGWPCNGPLLRLAEDVVSFIKFSFYFQLIAKILDYFRQSVYYRHLIQKPVCLMEQ